VPAHSRPLHNNIIIYIGRLKIRGGGDTRNRVQISLSSSRRSAVARRRRRRRRLPLRRQRYISFIGTVRRARSCSSPPHAHLNPKSISRSSIIILLYIAISFVFVRFSASPLPRPVVVIHLPPPRFTRSAPGSLRRRLSTSEKWTPEIHIIH